MLIISGIVIIADNKRITPQEKSIQLAKSFGNPKKDLTKRTIPKIKKTICERLVHAPKIKINPAKISIPPSALTNMFFKPNYSLKICACNSVWIRVPPS